MNSFINEFWHGLPNAAEVGRICFRLLAAMILGGAIGLQREHAGKPAGLRTHILTAMGAALFVMGAEEYGMGSDELSRIIQGLATGIGFIGGGAILKMASEHEIKGLTSAAGIWMTAAVGVAVGLGYWGVAAMAVIFTLVTLALLVRIEISGKDRADSFRQDD